MENKMKVAGTVDETEMIEMPAPTAWPIVLAFGLALLFAGFVTSWSISFLGAILVVSVLSDWGCA